MADNQICQVEISMLPNCIRVLDLSRNKIENLSGLEKLEQLENLDVSGNCISDESMIFLKDLENLTILNVSNNKIGRIGCVLEMKALRSLSVKGNPVVDECYRHQLLESLNSLKCLDDEKILDGCESEISKVERDQDSGIEDITRLHST